VVFNDGLRARQQAHRAGLPYIPDGALSKQVITQAKDTPQRAWLGEVSAVVLQQALADLNVAYRNFFASIAGKRKGRPVAPPRFRSRKDSRQAIRFTANARFRVLDNGRLRLPKIGDLRVRWSRELPALPSSVTLIKDAAGRYFASFVVQSPDEPLPAVESEVGIDLGPTHFAVLSDGTKVAAPRLPRRAARRPRRLHKALSRKTKGSNRRRRAVVALARAHARVADTRRDFHHKLSTTIIRDNQAVYVEDLAVVGLARTRLAKSVHDAGWSQLPLISRSWTCQCGSVHDRDINAARNVLATGRADNSNDRGARVGPPVMVALRSEAVIHPDAAPSTRSVAGIHVL